jgi:glycosyltransferase involved in cell wall biosynthesis
VQKATGFAVSWFFAPYLGSADIDFYKRIKNSQFDFDVVQVAREHRDDRILRLASSKINRFEVSADHKNPRAPLERTKFISETVRLFIENKSKYSFIISHSNEMVSHEAAAEIKKLYPNIPWIAYFGDLFIKNPYVKYIHGYPLVREDIEIERNTLVSADVIILNNDYQRQLMFTEELKRYQGKSVVIPHCYDPSFYPGDDRTEPDNNKFVFAHLGALYHVKRTAEPVLKAVDRLVDIYPKYKNKFEVIFYGGNPNSHDISVHAFMSSRNSVRFEDQISYIDSLRVMKETDCLLLIDGIFNEKDDGLKFSPFLPGKLMDYMGAKKPIMAITMNDGPTADIMRTSSNLIADEKIDRIAYVMKRYIDGKITPNYDTFVEYDVDVVAKKMDAVFSMALKGK